MKQLEHKIQEFADEYLDNLHSVYDYDSVYQTGGKNILHFDSTVHGCLLDVRDVYADCFRVDSNGDVFIYDYVSSWLFFEEENVKAVKKALDEIIMDEILR